MKLSENPIALRAWTESKSVPRLRASTAFGFVVSAKFEIRKNGCSGRIGSNFGAPTVRIPQVPSRAPKWSGRNGSNLWAGAPLASSAPDAHSPPACRLARQVTVEVAPSWAGPPQPRRKPNLGSATGTHSPNERAKRRTNGGCPQLGKCLATVGTVCGPHSGWIRFRGAGREGMAEYRSRNAPAVPQEPRFPRSPRCSQIHSRNRSLAVVREGTETGSPRFARNECFC